MICLPIFIQSFWLESAWWERVYGLDWKRGEHQQICYMAWILVISNEYYIVSFHTTLVPWEEFVCTSARLSVEHYASQWLCVSRYSAGIQCNMFCFFSSYINIGTVRLLGMHLWLFFWIVLFCWIIVCTLYFSVFFRFSWKPCCFNIVSILRSQLPCE